MNRYLKIFSGFTLSMLLLVLLMGCMAAWAFLYPAAFNSWLPFQQLRPMHVSAALFWIIGGGVSGILCFKKEIFGPAGRPGWERAFVLLWIATVLSVLISYSLKEFGGREYWEFPAFLGVPLLVGWVLLLFSFLKGWKQRPRPAPLYVWMWTTGLVFFLFTFLEQNLYQIPWFRQSFLREITVQWKSNGSMVGAWNQMIYGTSLFLMVRLSGDAGMAKSKTAFFFYFLGLTNLMFNWGHHIYNVPGAGWVRHVSYAISMTEWILFISIIQGFKAKMNESKRLGHLMTYRFLLAAEGWVFLNLTLALFMSIPAVNRYTHGTHITVAHAMGTTIGINTMILLAIFSEIVRAQTLRESARRWVHAGFVLTQGSLLVFWLALVVAGILKGYRQVALGLDNFQEIMQPVHEVLHVFALAGFILLAGLAMIALPFLRALLRLSPDDKEKSDSEKTEVVPDFQVE